jgi:uncharacterized protein (DUF433 family)
MNAKLKKTMISDPGILGGLPVVKGTRFPVSQVLAELADDYKLSEIADSFDLDVEILRELLSGLSLQYEAKP